MPPEEQLSRRMCLARCEYAVEHLVKSDDISVGKLALIGKTRRIRIGHMPVHIPFDIAYLRAVERFSDAFNNVIAHLLARKIQQKLISAEARLADGGFIAQSGCVR